MSVRKCGLVRESTRLFLMVPLLSGILYATPMKDAGEWGLQGSKQLLSPPLATTKANRAFEAVDVAVTLGFRPRSSSQASTANCVLASNCSNPVEIPEPQSWLLLGTGLLSMAGLIRRRLSS